VEKQFLNKTFSEYTDIKGKLDELIRMESKYGGGNLSP
jgi:hypothetical protein